MWTRACVLASTTGLALCVIGPAARAAETLELTLAPTSALPRLPVYEALIVEVSVNGRSSGEFTLYRDRDNDFYVKDVELSRLGLAARAEAARRVLIEGAPYVPLRQFAPHKLAFDEARLVLEIEFPVPALRTSTYDLTVRRPNPPEDPTQPGAFLNYRLSASDGNGMEPLKLAFASELALRFNGVLARHESAVVNTDGSTHNVRYATQIVYDRLAEQQRLVIGDQTAASGELGSTLPVGGIGFSKLYQLTPYFIRQPLAGYAGTVSTPSQVEVRMGGVPVFRELVPAGPFEVRNLQQFAGARDVEILVRDAMGREQLVGFPYYFADHALRQGLHEYSYSAGAVREDLGVHSNNYGTGLASAVHRYGLTDRVTIGARGEAASGLANFGPTLLYRNDLLGVFSAGLSGSRHDGRDGAAGSLGHVYQARYFGFHLNARRYSEHYATAQDLISPAGLQAEYIVGGSLNLGAFGSVYLDRSVTKRQESSPIHDSASTTLNYAYTLGRYGSFFATAAHVTRERTDNRFFIGLLINLDRTKTAHLSARRSDNGGDTIYGAQFVSAVPAGEGLGYRVGYDGIGGAETQQAVGFAQYNARAMSFTLDATAERRGVERVERYEVAAAGAVTWTAGSFGLTRRIDDSFVAVQLASPLEGVRVYSNNQEVGRTDREGRLIVPNVGSFHETQIAIDESDVPLDHAIGALRRVVAPAYRSGALLHFDVYRVHAVEGRLLVGGRPAGY